MAPRSTPKPGSKRRRALDAQSRADARALSRHLPSIRLDAATAAVEAPAWLHVATEGVYEGHSMGPFEFNRAVFEDLVKNLRAHPWFLAGADGLGCSDVVQWDFDHASEANPTDGDLPVTGAPAQAWVLDLKIEDGADGKCQLWALTRYLPLARQYVKEGKYRSASVAVWFDAIDPITGDDIGAELTSVAFTNRPFIQGMTPLAANRKTRASILRDPSADWGPIKTPADILPVLARDFEIDDGTADEALLPAVQAKVALLKSWLVPGAVIPTGIDPLYAISQLRMTLGLPTLTPPEEVIEELEELFAALAGTPVVEEAEPGSAPIPPPLGAARRPKETPVNDPKTPTTLAATLIAVDPYEGLCKRFNLSTVDPEKAVLKLMGDAAAATNDAAALIKALGATDMASATARVTQLLQCEAAMADMKPKYDALVAKDQQAAAAQETADVEAAIQTHRMPETARPALMLHRRQDPAGFAKAFPQPSADHAPLATPVFTTRETPTGSPLDRLSAGANGVALSGQRPAAPPPGPGGGRINLSGYKGRNAVEKTIAYIRTTDEGKNLSWEDANARANELLHSGAVVVG